jgi:hypothetical protein
MKITALIVFHLLPQLNAFAPPLTNRLTKYGHAHVSRKFGIQVNGDGSNHVQDYSEMTVLPRHPTNEEANEILIQTEAAIKKMQERELFLAAGEEKNAIWSKSVGNRQTLNAVIEEEEELPMEVETESVYANSYVDLGKVDTVGFDFDYTLVTYTQQLLELIYDMALRRLVTEKEYPSAMLSSGLKVRWMHCWFFKDYLSSSVFKFVGCHLYSSLIHSLA